MTIYGIPAVLSENTRSRKRKSNDGNHPSKRARNEDIKIETENFHKKKMKKSGIRMKSNGSFETSRFRQGYIETPRFRQPHRAHGNIETASFRQSKKPRVFKNLHHENGDYYTVELGAGGIPAESDRPWPNPRSPPKWPEPRERYPYNDDYRQPPPPFAGPNRDDFMPFPPPDQYPYHQPPPPPRYLFPPDEPEWIPPGDQMSLTLQDIISRTDATFDVQKNNVNEMKRKDWEKLGFFPKMAREIVTEFKGGVKFYERNSHVYINIDFRNLLWNIYDGPPELDTHSCPLANEGKDGVGAKKIFGPKDNEDGYSTNWDFQRVYSNPPYGHAGGDKKFVAKCIYEKYRHQRKFKITGKTYEHCGIHAMETKYMDDWWAMMRSHCCLWYYVDRLKFRVWNEDKGTFDDKHVYPTRCVVFWYIAVGTEQFKHERSAAIREYIHREFGDRGMDYSPDYGELS